MSKFNSKMKGCCGWTYQKHSRNIAIFLIVYTFLCSLLTVSFGLWFGFFIPGSPTSVDKNTNSIQDPQIGMDEKKTDADIEVMLFQGILVYLCIHAVLPVIASFLLLFGSIKNNRIVILIWLVFTMIQIVSYLAFICGCSIQITNIFGGTSNCSNIGCAFQYAYLLYFAIALSIHFLMFLPFWIVVFLFYQELTKNA